LIPYSQDPKPFLSNIEIKKEIVKIFPGGGVKEIQNRVYIDDKHVFVPYITERNTYGMINWEWKRNEWSLTSVETNTDDPKLLKIKTNHTLKRYLIWNINPTYNINQINFYLTRKRQFSVTEGVSKYEPRIQLKLKKKINESSYGVLRLPKSWERIMNDDSLLNSPKQFDSIFSSFIPPTSMMVSWIALDKNEKINYPINSEPGNGYSSGENYFDFVPFVSESELEVEKITVPTHE
jgi:hypothetical protein